MRGDGLPEGWVREYEGRHGAEFYHEARNLTVSVLPRYDSPAGRASAMTPAGYTVRVHRLFSSDFAVPLTVGTTTTFGAAKELATEYMEQFSTEFVRKGGPNETVIIEALSAVADYSDDLLVSVVQSRTGWGLAGVAHCTPASVEVVYREDDLTLSQSEATGLYEAVRDGAVATAGSDRPVGTLTTTEAGTVVWLTPDGDPEAGTLFLFAPDTPLSVPAFFEDTADLLRGRPGQRAR
ncbi:hypothetical protein [Haloarchaeobius sp. HME9146]|uniref:hypothetical protein n=1 Tax=Haloarchaeobius sp. HME9146 TaxID=2978732 RepID=UPI0021C0FE24|nr:hypothetical protein [Haloarchaeobius sp. HME9146]MCT9095418.1 hypothetical protein [Haloarchaeobius sp. HME9146]